MPPDGRSSLSDWVDELKRRNVFRVAAVYAGVGFVLVQATAYVFEALLFPAWAHRLFVVFVLAGFPVALVLAWAFEVTPEGVRLSPGEPDTDGGEEGAERAARRAGSTGTAVAVGLVGVAGAVAALAGWVAWESLRSPDGRHSASGDSPSAGAVADSLADGEVPSELRATRIAVLYFDDHSEDGELGHVAAGLTESLIHELNRAPGLDVISRNGVKPYRNPQVPLDSLARILGAGSLVEGSVEREGNQLLVTVQLVDGATASHLVSERVRGRVDAPLEVRNELVERVASLLRRELGREVRLRQARAGTESQEAWELYHLAREVRSDADSFRQERDIESAHRLFLQADSIFARAEEADPGWPWPTLGRGEVALSLGRLGSVEVTGSRGEWLRRGVEHANRVLSEDPDDAAALELRGELRYFLARIRDFPEADSTLAEAERDLRRAVSKDPGRAGAWSRLAYLLQNDARFAEARSALRRSREADRFLREERDYLFQQASLALDLEEFGRAGELLRRALEDYPEVPAFSFKRLQYLASTASRPEQVGEAWDVLDRFESLTGTRPYMPGRALVAAVVARAGLGDSARAVLQRVGTDRKMSPHTALNAAYARLQLREEARALDLLGRYLEANPGQRDYVAREWWWRPLRDHPRFRSLVDDSTLSAGGPGLPGAAPDADRSVRDYQGSTMLPGSRERVSSRSPPQTWTSKS